MDERLGIVLVSSHTVHVAEEYQLLSPHRLGNGCRGRVRVHVELLAALCKAHRRNYRNDPTAAKIVDGLLVHASHSTDMAQIDIRSIFALQRDSLAEQHVARLEVEPFRSTTKPVDFLHDLPIDRTAQNTFHDAQSRVIRISTSLYPSRLQAGFRHPTADRCAAPVNDHGTHPDCLHEDYVKQEA